MLYNLKKYVLRENIMFKKILVFARKSMKLTILIAISVFLIICAVALFFKPIYIT